MSEKIGAVHLGNSGGEVFLGRDMGSDREYSESLAGKVDVEVRKLIEEAHDEAWRALNNNRDILDALVLELLEKETLEAARLAEIFAPVRKEPKRDVWLSSEQRAVSPRGPVMTPAEQAALSRGQDPNADGPTEQMPVHPPVQTWDPPSGPLRGENEFNSGDPDGGLDV